MIRNDQKSTGTSGIVDRRFVDLSGRGVRYVGIRYALSRKA